MTRIIKLQDKGDRLLRVTHGLRQKGRGCGGLSPLWVWMPPLPTFEALHLAETSQLVSGHPERGQSQPWPMGPCLGKKPEDSKRVTESSGPGLQLPWSERAGLGAAC